MSTSSGGTPPSPFDFVSRVEAVYPLEGLFSFDLPRHGETWALRIFPQLLCMEALIQASKLLLESPELQFDLEGVRFTGCPWGGDTLVLKLRSQGPDLRSAELKGEVWVHHRMVAQATLLPWRA